MPPAPQKDLLPSFLDRLIDAGQRDASGGAVVYSLEQMIDAVRADLEDLLNTRQSQPMHECPYPLVRESILAYGLPDLNSIPGTTRDLDAIAEHIGKLVETFEPRLRNVRVEIETDDNGPEGQDAKQARFQISGGLNVDPAPEVGFETVVELATGQAKVSTSAVLP